MSFYISLSGLKGAQTDLATISNNVANVNADDGSKRTGSSGCKFRQGTTDPGSVSNTRKVGPRLHSYECNRQPAWRKVYMYSRANWPPVQEDVAMELDAREEIDGQ